MKLLLCAACISMTVVAASAEEISVRAGTGHMTAMYSSALHNPVAYGGVTFAIPEPIGWGVQPRVYPEFEVGIWTASNRGVVHPMPVQYRGLDYIHEKPELNGFLGTAEWLRVVFSGRAVGERPPHAVWIDLGLGAGFDQLWKRYQTYDWSGTNGRVEVFARTNLKTSAVHSLYIEGKYMGGKGYAGNLDWLVVAGLRTNLS